MRDEDRELKKGSVELLVLALVEEQPRHGYEIAKVIETRSEGALRFHAASLYPALYRMERKGWIQGRWVEKAGQRRRRYYRISAEGRRVLAARRNLWRSSSWSSAGWEGSAMSEWRGEVREAIGRLGISREREAEVVEEVAQHVSSRYEDVFARSRRIDATLSRESNGDATLRPCGFSCNTAGTGWRWTCRADA